MTLLAGQATLEERELLKTLNWWDGFVVALANPAFLIAAFGFSVGTLGPWWAIGLWTGSMVIGALQTWIYSEPATMFPSKSGGIALYAHEGWKKYFSPIGPISTFGYWFGWSAVLSINGLLLGSLIQGEWFTKTTWAWHFGWSSVTLPKLLGIIAILLVFLFNARGMRPAVWVSYVTGVLLCIPLVVVMFGAFVSGDFHTANLRGGYSGSWTIILVWLYLMGWSSYGVEACASFAPEYKDTRRDTPLALRSSSLFSVLVFFLLPLGVVGTLGAGGVCGSDPKTCPAAAGGYLVDTMHKVVGGGTTGLLLIFVLAGLVLSMNTATMDGSRALYGISRHDMTIKALGKLNRFHVPGNALTVDAVLNILLLILFNSTLGILAASNVGYMLAHVFALTGFILLRKDRPNWPRPLRVSNLWVPIAGLLAAANLLFIVVGFVKFKDTGYTTGHKVGPFYVEQVIGVLILLAGLGLFIYRRVVEDKGKLTRTEPYDPLPTAAERALLEQEEVPVPI
jgi:amino acid transporter